MAIRLDVLKDGKWEETNRVKTNADGRVSEVLLRGASFFPGQYRLTFETAAYFESQGLKCFYPHVEILFQVDDETQHYHVPLLISPFGYSTYRGS